MKAGCGEIPSAKPRVDDRKRQYLFLPPLGHPVFPEPAVDGRYRKLPVRRTEPGRDNSIAAACRDDFFYGEARHAEALYEYRSFRATNNT